MSVLAASHEGSPMASLALVRERVDVDAALDAVRAVGGALDQLGVEFPDKPEFCSPIAVDAIERVENLMAWLEARRNELLVHACGTEMVRLSEDPADLSRSFSDLRSAEIATVLNVPINRAKNLVHDARILVCELTHANELLSRGDITPYKATLVAQGFGKLVTRYKNAKTEVPIDLALRFERRVLRRAELQTVGELRRTITKAQSMLAPRDEPAVLQAAKAERCVTLQHTSDGMSWLNAYLPSAEASRVYQVLVHSARNDSSLKGSEQVRMADALVKIVDGTSEMSAETRSKAAELQVMVAFDAMMAVANGDPNARLVGEIASTGLLVEGQALMELIGDAKFRRLVFNSQTGQLLDYGRNTYQPPNNLRDHVAARDVTCRAPGCDRPAKYCDVDHVVAYNDGGETSDQNLATLCRTHHLLKTHGEWRYTLEPDGSTQWSLPGERKPIKLLDNPYNDLALSPGTLYSFDTSMSRTTGLPEFDEHTKTGVRQRHRVSIEKAEVGADDPPPF